ncbi:aldo/keto reductase [Ferruginibacter lapsinanis]|uniref:aldo/keto reductase n=1 Tax=Ferruginibacter lapsinanis TaxID=563172 RepID=UPI001E3F5E29|nr:aldo/keto reductase [Ferruginibacter lapsinanis]UEG49003.1 aldo/keto reductase [Ferruginibacter lapsinanis]
MKKIYLSDSGPKVSEAIYGFYRWTEEELSATKMESIINLCLELGINTFDHADTYGGYQCEEVFGKAIANKSIKREDLVLFTKCGEKIPHPSKPDIRVRHYDTSSEHIIKSLDNSLKNLRTDYIDVFLLNNLDPISDLESTALTLQKLKESGKIKNIGVVNFSVFQHQLLSSYLKSPIVTNHIELNLLNTTALDNGQIDYIKQKYMRPLATAPLAEGKIADSTDRVPLWVRAKLEELSPKYNADIESIAVAWLVKLGALPLIGTTDEKRIRNIANAFSIDLDRQDWYSLYNIAKG